MAFLFTLKRAIPISVRRRLYRLCEEAYGRCRWWSIRFRRVPTGLETRVFYGPDQIRPVHGGLVKIRRMQAAFPNFQADFNVLYMVSSSLPYSGLQLARAAKKNGRINLVWNQNGVAYPGWMGPDWQKWINAPMAALHSLADYVFYQSEFCKLSADRFLGPRSGPWEVLYNAVDTSRFTPATQDPAPGRLVMLLGGSQHKAYRLETALHVLARVLKEGVNAQLLVTGQMRWLGDSLEDRRRAEGEAAEMVRKLRVEERVRFFGLYTQEEAPSLYRQTHVLLHTKINDSCPELVIEAMACGLPVVYSASGGVPELVGDEAGIGVPAELNWERDIPPDPDAMVQAVLTVAADRARFSSAARQRAVERFDLQPWLRRHREVFEKLVG